jgi:hypothetical protein
MKHGEEAVGGETSGHRPHKASSAGCGLCPCREQRTAQIVEDLDDDGVWKHIFEVALGSCGGRRLSQVQ